MIFISPQKLSFSFSGYLGLIGKIRVNSNFMASQLGKQTLAINILPNISKSKGNKIMKFGLFIKYNKKNSFLQKLCTNTFKYLDNQKSI